MVGSAASAGGSRCPSFPSIGAILRRRSSTLSIASRGSHREPLTADPLLRLAQVGGAAAPEACARSARELVTERLPADPFDAAVRIKRLLAARGFRDDPTAFALPDMLARRAGNCLGLTLLIGGVLIDRGHDVEFVVQLDPLDDVHDAGVEYCGRLHDPARGVDADSRLPDARDCSPRFRFVPVEHSSIVLPGAGAGRVFEATSLTDLEASPGWAPAAEARRTLGFTALSAAVWCERAKALVRRAPDEPDAWRAALGLALRAARSDRDHREAWTEVWQAARVLGRGALAAAAMAQHARHGGDDSLFWFTRYRMTGEEVCVDRALARLPEYADAYLEKHVVVPLVRGAADEALDEIRRRFAIAAWMVARSEILDLEPLYRRHAAIIARLFGPDELAALLASFDAARAGGADSRT